MITLKLTINIHNSCSFTYGFRYVELLSEKQQLQASCESHHRIKLLQGLIGAIQCLGELPFFFISGKFAI